MVELNALARNLAPKDDILSAPIVSSLNKRYLLKERIGIGGLCEVFAATDKRIEGFNDRREIAIKTPTAEMMKKSDIAAFLYAEHCFLTRISHRNIVKALDYDIDAKSKVPFIVMERLRGDLLCDAALALSVREKTKIFAEISSAVDYVHSLGIVHADINPKNVICADNEAKLFDFGVALDLRENKAFHLDRENIKAFNPLYAAPEVINGQTPTIESDIFSLATTFYEFYGGTLPYKENALELATAPVTIKALKSIPILLRIWFYRALQTDPKKRPSNAPIIFRKLSTFDLLFALTAPFASARKDSYAA
jgi:serine/threonine protein kinase